MAGLRFCAYQYQHLPLDVLRGRWRDAERSGFDVLWNCDTVVEPDRPLHMMFDGPATLAPRAAAANPGLPRSLSRAPSSSCQRDQAPTVAAEGA